MDPVNPYAAPQRDSLPFTPSTATPGQPIPWEAVEVLREGGDLFRRQWAVVLATFVVGYFIQQAPNFVLNFAKAFGGDRHEATSTILTIVIAPLALALSAYIQVGFMRIWSSVARGETPEFALLFSGASRLLPMLGAMILAGLAIVLGLLCFIVPGLILAAGLSNTMFLVADADLGPVEAMQASWKSMDGSKGQYVLFLLLGGLLQLAGLLACCVGLLVTSPVFFLASAVIYTHTTGRMGNLPQLSEDLPPYQTR